MPEHNYQKSQEKGHPVANLASQSSNNNARAHDPSPCPLLSPPTLELLSAPTQAQRSATNTNTTGAKLPHKRRTKAACLPSDTLSINGSLDPLDTLDKSNILPGAFPMNGQNSSPPFIEETIDPSNDIFDTPALVAEVVPDEEEMVAEMKNRLRKEIKEEEVAMRLMTEGTEGQTPVVAEVVTATSVSASQKIPSWLAWRSMLPLLVVILIIVGTVVGVFATKPHEVGVVTTRPQDDYGVVPSPKDDVAGVVTKTQEDDNNTVCLEATPMEESKHAISSWIQERATKLDGSIYPSVCLPYDTETTINWFSFVGTGDAYTVSTCSSDLNFDSQLSVATGPCDKLECLGFSDPYSSFTGSCTESSHYAGPLLFRTDVGVLYYLGVGSANSFSFNGQSKLNFTLSIAKVVNAPVNSDCSSSIVIKQGDDLVQGTITNATLDVNFNNTCASSNAGVWYSIVGTGDVIDILTSASDFTSALTISKGSCENLECMVSVYGMDGPDGEYIPARVAFRSEVGVEYFLQVHQDNNIDIWIGNFTLEISYLSRGPANEDCSSASVLELGTNGSSIMGAMGNTYWDPDMNVSCSVVSITGVTQIVWYSLIGTGDVYDISTCSSVLNFNSTISVMTGGCDSLECLIPSRSTQYDCPEASYGAGRALLGTEVGVEYFIAVEASTYYTLEGNFLLNVSIFEPLPNGECSGALDIQANGETVYGSSLEIFPTGFNSSTYGFGPDFWYRIVGDGTNIVASLCGSAPYGSLIQIFEGDGVSCNQTLVAENEEFCDVLWLAELGVTYYIRVVSYYDGDTGQFGLTLQYP